MLQHSKGNGELKVVTSRQIQKNAHRNSCDVKQVSDPWQQVNSVATQQLQANVK